jgi:hypothetical protein
VIVVGHVIHLVTSPVIALVTGMLFMMRLLMGRLGKQSGAHSVTGTRLPARIPRGSSSSRCANRSRLSHSSTMST